MGRARILLLGLIVVLGVLSCAVQVLAPRADGPGRQGWSAELGPVVPHDRFPADCSECHAGADWRTIRADFQFDHERETGVALLGAHASARCLRCHNDRGPVSLFAARGCAGCHEDAHRGRLGPLCAECHGESDWGARGARADHARTRFPLVGAHAAAACERCHPGEPVQNFENADPACESCHQDDLARATVPNHALEGWTSGCEHCHGVNEWSDATFQHRPADFHCVECHRDDFDRARAPDHVGGGYPTDCLFCHYGKTSWTGGYFVHFWFPITSGAHAGVACTVCHGPGGSIANANCLVCHEHAQRPMARAHQGVRGYVYQSDDCWSCHPDGVAGR